MFTQLSDESFYLGLSTEEELEASFRLNLAFFDSICCTAPAIIGNPWLFRQTVNNKAAMSEFYKDGSITMVIPSDLDPSDAVIAVAERMIQKGSIHRLSSASELRQHAKLIQQSNPHFLYFDESSFRVGYQEILANALDHIDDFGMTDWRTGKRILPDNKVGILREWVEGTEPSEITCSKIYHLADDFSPDHHLAIKSHALMCYFKAISDELALKPSCSSNAVPYLQYADIGQLVDGNITEVPLVSEHVLSFPLQAILNLPFWAIHLLRDDLKGMRDKISDFRRLPSEKNLQNFNESCDGLRHAMIVLGDQKAHQEFTSRLLLRCLQQDTLTIRTIFTKSQSVIPHMIQLCFESLAPYAKVVVDMITFAARWSEENKGSKIDLESLESIQEGDDRLISHDVITGKSTILK